MLKINRSMFEDTPMISHYAQGISAQCIILKDITYWAIFRIRFIRGKPVKYRLNRHFIAAQRLMKAYCRFLRKCRSLRVLLEREKTGKSLRWRAPPTGELYV